MLKFQGEPETWNMKLETGNSKAATESDEIRGGLWQKFVS